MPAAPGTQLQQLARYLALLEGISGFHRWERTLSKRKSVALLPVPFQCSVKRCKPDAGQERPLARFPKEGSRGAVFVPEIHGLRFCV